MSTTSHALTPDQLDSWGLFRGPFLYTLRRDYIVGADLATAAVVLDQIPGWIADYNAVAPHSALGYRSPHQYRSAQLVAGLTC